MILVPVHLASTISSLASSSFKLKILGPPNPKDLKNMIVFSLIELVSILSIVYVSVKTGEEKGIPAAMLSGTFTVLLLYILPKLLLPWGIQETCKDCEPIGKFSVGITTMLGVVVVERIMRHMFTYK